MRLQLRLHTVTLEVTEPKNQNLNLFFDGMFLEWLRNQDSPTTLRTPVLRCVGSPRSARHAILSCRPAENSPLESPAGRGPRFESWFPSRLRLQKKQKRHETRPIELDDFIMAGEPGFEPR